MQEPRPPLEVILEDAGKFYTQASSSLSTWSGNFQRNTKSSFARMSTKNWIRLTVVVCAYILLRPHIMKIMAKVQAKQLQKMGDEDTAARAEMDANDLRGIVKIPGVESDDDDEVEEVRENEWGRKARVRQRKVVRKAMERHEEMLSMVGHESDKDIEDLLED
ncbi:DUF1531-domain-containing protein [Tothia fuscella]|uniref:DUF1531-domain-containing protein n=1 Tax=Tothia fuscella TaxID=1048955 RepID=A0A9P4NKC0_9PEZI|nr:DUF1531-domain-containing protein [Tothia fuscella]